MPSNITNVKKGVSELVGGRFVVCLIRRDWKVFFSAEIVNKNIINTRNEVVNL